MGGNDRPSLSLFLPACEVAGQLHQESMECQQLITLTRSLARRQKKTGGARAGNDSTPRIFRLAGNSGTRVSRSVPDTDIPARRPYPAPGFFPSQGLEPRRRTIRGLDRSASVNSIASFPLTDAPRRPLVTRWRVTFKVNAQRTRLSGGGV